MIYDSKALKRLHLIVSLAISFATVYGTTV